MSDKAIAKFPNKQFDSSLTYLLKGLNDNFGLSTKGSFVFLAGYGLKYPESYAEHINDSFDSKGSEWRDDTDTGYDTAVDILIERFSSQKGYQFKDVRSDGDLLKKVVDDLMKIANSVGRDWLEGELSSFKKGVSGDEKETFVRLVSSYLEELNKSVDPF